MTLADDDLRVVLVSGRTYKTLKGTLASLRKGKRRLEAEELERVLGQYEGNRRVVLAHPDAVIVVDAEIAGGPLVRSGQILETRRG